MLRRVRRLALLVIVALIAGLAVLVLTMRPRLDDRRRAVERAWQQLSPELETRISALASLDQSVRAAAPVVLDPSSAVRDSLQRWATARRGNLDARIRAVNDLEGSGRRLLALVSDQHRRYVSVQAVRDAATAYLRAAIPPADVAAFDKAVDHYDAASGGTVRRLVADLLGTDPLPHLVTA